MKCEENLCKQDCKYRVGRIEVERQGDCGTMRDPEPYTYKDKVFVCSKYNKQIKNVEEWFLLEFCIKKGFENDSIKCDECIEEIEVTNDKM